MLLSLKKSHGVTSQSSVRIYCCKRPNCDFCILQGQY